MDITHYYILLYIINPTKFCIVFLLLICLKILKDLTILIECPDRLMLDRYLVGVMAEVRFLLRALK